MSLFDIIADALGAILGISDEGWQDRLKGEISLTSPEGEDFFAFWVGNERSHTKKLGLFEFPGIDGTKAQDLQSSGTRYPLNIFFAGKNNDKEANAFFKATKQPGVWKVGHPVHGLLDYQIISVTERTFPVSSGGVTEFQIEGIEPLPDGSTISYSQTQAELDDFGALADAASADQFNTNIVQDTFNQIQAVVGTVGRCISAVKTTLRAIESFELIPSEINAVIAGIQSTIASFPIDTTQLAAQVQTLVDLFGQAQTTTTEALIMYADFIDEILIAAETPSATQESKNKIATQELFISAALVSQSKVTKLGGEKTRSETLSNAEIVSSSITTSANGLDAKQELFNASPIELQYFSQSQAYTDVLECSILAVKLLLERSLSVAVERKFTLTEDRNPVEITATEYGSLGDGDSNLDLFLESNGITGSGFFVIPSGSEVVVYG